MSQLVVLYGARQLKVKVTAATLLKEVKERACSVLELNPDDYDLRSGKTMLNAALPFRLSNLVSNAKVELVLAQRKKARNNISVKLQVSDLPPDFSEKLIYEFGPTTTVWAILKFFEKSGINFTQRSATGGYYEFPTVQLFNTKLQSFQELNQTLEQLGIINGSLALRVKFDKVAMKLEDALEKQKDLNCEITAMEPIKTPTSKDTPPASTPSRAQGQQQQQQQSQPLPKERPQPQSQQQLEPQVDRHTQAYLPSESTRQIPEDNLEGSSMNMKAFELYRQQISKVSESHRQDAPLMTKRMREQQEQSKSVKKPESCTIRVRLPDQTHIQGDFDLKETVGSLHSFVKSSLKDPETPFLLFVTPPRRYLADPNQLLGEDWNFGAREVVYFEWDSGAGKKSGILKDELIHNAKSIIESESIKIDEKQPTMKEAFGDPAKKKKNPLSGGKPSWLKLSKK